MNILYLVSREISRRKINYLIGFAIVVITTAIVIGTLSLLKSHDLQTAQIMENKEAELNERVRLLQDDYRKISLELGFNLLIIPEGQNLGNFYADDFASKYMDESVTDKLVTSRTLTVQHLLPSLTQKIVWPEFKQSIILTGTKGEVPYLYRNPKKPMLQPVPDGGIVLGYELHRILNLKKGDKVTLLGRTFIVTQCNERRGSKDDATVWIPLKDAQELLDKKGKINAILALKCHCASGTLQNIIQSVKELIPNVQVLQKNKEVTIRAKARDRAKREAKEALKAEELSRTELKNEQLRFAKVLIPMVIVTGAFMIFLTFIANVKSRQDEIGILRTIGTKQHTILLMFLLKATLTAIPAAVLGYLLGILTLLFTSETVEAINIFSVAAMLSAVISALVISISASWLPALYASQQDPAKIIQD